MKFYKPLLLLFLPIVALASTSTLTNTVITDPDSQTWNNCTWSAQLNSPNGPPTISGVPVAANLLSAAGSCSSVGKITATLTDTGSLDQTGATWVFTLTPNASSVFGPAVISTTAVTGATPNLSTVLSVVSAPRFPPGNASFGYLSGEVQNPIVGSVFFDVTGGCQRQYSLAGWSICSTGGGSGTVTSVSVTAANGVSGTVATATTTPAISLTLGAIVPTSVNGITLTTGGSATTFLNGAGAYTTPSGGGACGSGNIPCTNTINTFSAAGAQTIVSTAATGNTLALSNTSTSNVAILDMQSAGGDDFQLVDGGTDFAAGWAYLNDATTSGIQVAWKGTIETLQSTGVYGWVISTNPASAPDTGVSRVSAGVVGIGNGTAGNAGGQLSVANVHATAIVSTGTKFTTSGCSVSSTTGGATAGRFTVGANTCTVIVTLNGATGFTAPNGWACTANDETSTTVFAIQQTASNTTTASFSIPSTAGATDVVNFSCTAY